MNVAQKRTLEKWAGIAYAASFAISTLFDYRTRTGYFDNSSDETPSPASLALVHALVFAHAYVVWKGKTWAKVLMLVFLTGLAAAVITSAVQGKIFVPNAHALFQWGLGLVEVILLVLSFRRPRHTSPKV